ncbi:endonuclease/exonuclease/phosphatase family protein [Actinoplanes sp. NPDC051851]|uniref:endonuclease/exonuclease/phosphatase family protein n=1 Tax=Actinoplanes sp. NPDC051851 TaxID=3154753 RepID=UPI003419D36B
MTITDAPPGTRPARRRTIGTVLLWLLLLPGLCWTVIRLGGWEGHSPLVPLLAFTPYVAVGAWVPALIGLLTRRRLPGVVALLTAVALAACVLPRALPDLDKGLSRGVALHVMTSNMLFGGADAATIVTLVRENDVAVLAVQEFSPGAERSLAEAGLGDLLPYSQLSPEWGATGSGLYSRYPLTGTGTRINQGGFHQAYGVIQPDGAAPVLVESAHPLAPAGLDLLAGWAGDMAAEPRADPAGTARILLGDFNSTLDLAPLRTLIASGYRDAADTVGRGLVGTWGPYDGDPIPPVTIDHVLADTRIGVQDVTVHNVPRSDHRAVIAGLILPMAS